MSSMTTASLVLYKTPRSQIETLLSSVLPSCAGKLIVVDNSPDDRWRELEGRSEKIRYTSSAMRRTGGLRTMGKKILDEIQKMNSALIKLKRGAI